MVAFETLAFGDLWLLVKVRRPVRPVGGAVQQLGTRLHHERYREPTARLELCGCFAMTEADHGSNVQALETTATYDPDAGEFVVDTPSDGARKEYIGNAACHGHVAAVFAQLVVHGSATVSTCWWFRSANEHGDVCAGVRIEDCGEKMGLNGADNGRLRFDHEVGADDRHSPRASTQAVRSAG